MGQRSCRMEFYEAMLSEMIAYAEVDVDTGSPQVIGGIWQPYQQECQQTGNDFWKVIRDHITEFASPEDAAQCCRYFDRNTIRRLYDDGRHTQKYGLQWMVGESLHWIELIIHVVQEPQSGRLYALLCMNDIDKRRRREIAQESAANTDSLTCVYNRRKFEQLMSDYVQRADGETAGMLVFLDIDNFKDINDHFGHMEGDAALRRVADILKGTFRQKDLVARFGGDEFLVFVCGAGDRELLNQRLRELFRNLLHNEQMPITCSVGVRVVSRIDFSYERCVREADLALHRSKLQGKNQVCYYEDI